MSYILDYILCWTSAATVMSDYSWFTTSTAGTRTGGPRFRELPNDSSQNKGTPPQYRPKNTIILSIGSHKRVPLILWVSSWGLFEVLYTIMIQGLGDHSTGVD